MIMDNGAIYPPAVLDISEDDIKAKFGVAVGRVAALSLAVSLPNKASAPHMIMNAFKNLLAISVTTDYTFPESEQVKAFIENPDAFVSAAPAGGGGGGDAPAAAAPAPAPESESEEDMEMGLFD